MPTTTQAALTQQQLFDVNDAAAYLIALGAKGVTVHFVRALINSGQLAHVPMGKKFFVSKTALDGWLSRSEKRRRT